MRPSIASSMHQPVDPSRHLRVLVGAEVGDQLHAVVARLARRVDAVEIDLDVRHRAPLPQLPRMLLEHLGGAEDTPTVRIWVGLGPGLGLGLVLGS